MLILGLCTLGYKHFQLKQEQKQLTEEDTRFRERINIKILDQVSLSEKFSIANEPLIRDSTNNRLLLNSIIHKKKLIFFFSITNCSDCVQHNMNNLREYFKGRSAENVFIMCSSKSNDTWFKDFKKKYDFDFPIFEIEDKYIPRHIISMNKPLYFIMDSSGTASLVLPAEIDLKELTFQYYSLVKSSLN